MTAGATERVFFALYPDPDTRAACAQVAGSLQRVWGGRPMRAESLHLTLAFLGNTPRARLDELLARAAGIRAAAFSVLLDRPGCWAHNRIGWLGPSAPPAALTQLVTGLRDLLQAGGFACDARTYQPHVTLLRDVQCGGFVECEPVTWRAQDFALLASPRCGAACGYGVLAAWPLAPAA